MSRILSNSTLTNSNGSSKSLSSSGTNTPKTALQDNSDMNKGKENHPQADFKVRRSTITAEEIAEALKSAKSFTPSVQFVVSTTGK